MAFTRRGGEFSIEVDDHGLADAIEFFAKRGLERAERKGINEHVRMVQQVAKGEAPFNPGGVSRKTMIREGKPSGRVGIKDYKLRFYGGGTDVRSTRAGLNRGFIVADDFIGRTAAKTDPLAERTIDRVIQQELEARGIA